MSSPAQDFCYWWTRPCTKQLQVFDTRPQRSSDTTMMSGDHNGPMSTKWCLVVDDGIDLWSSNVDGAPFPQEQLTRINPISRGCTPRLRMVITVVLLAEILTLSMQKYWVHSKSLKYNLPSTFLFSKISKSPGNSKAVLKCISNIFLNKY